MEITVGTIKEALGYRPLIVKFKKLDEKAVIPFYAHNGDVGMDMTAIDVEYNEQLDLYIYHTGLSFESDFHYGQLLFPRSSNRKTDAYLCNSVGIADSAIYRGEIMFCYKNRDSLEAIANNAALKAFMDAILGGETIETAAIMYNNCKSDVLSRPLDFAPYNVGDKIGQMVMIAYPDVKLEEANELSSSERGANGFGSTGN
jgi:dUTP pyrophosphatase